MYFTTKTVYKSEDENGKVKKTKEVYLIEAESITEATAIAFQKFGEGVSDFSVTNVNETNYMDVITYAERH